MHHLKGDRYIIEYQYIIRISKALAPPPPFNWKLNRCITDVIKGIISRVCMPNMKSSISKGIKIKIDLPSN